MEPHPCPALGLHIPTMALQVGGVAQVLLSPWTAELGAVFQGTQKAVWDINLSLGGLMNDTGLLLWQGTSLGSAVTKQLLNRFLSSQCFCGCQWLSEDALGNFQFWWVWQEQSRCIFSRSSQERKRSNWSRMWNEEPWSETDLCSHCLNEAPGHQFSYLFVFCLSVLLDTPALLPWRAPLPRIYPGEDVHGPGPCHVEWGK